MFDLCFYFAYSGFYKVFEYEGSLNRACLKSFSLEGLRGTVCCRVLWLATGTLLPYILACVQLGSISSQYTLNMSTPCLHTALL